MKFMQFVWQGGKLVFLTVVCWLAVHGAVLAELPQQKEESGGGTYVLPYALVILAIALGMMSVLRPSHRRDRAKPEVYDEIKTKAKD